MVWLFVEDGDVLEASLREMYCRTEPKYSGADDDN